MNSGHIASQRNWLTFQGHDALLWSRQGVTSGEAVSRYQWIIGRFYLIGLVIGAWLLVGPIWFASSINRAWSRILHGPESSRI